MKELIDGTRQFKKNVYKTQKPLFQKLSKGQHPKALFITCSDSRIAPNLITQMQPGDLFVLRNAGNIVPPVSAGVTGQAATIEFAVNALGVKDIVICGHSQCGAIQALLDDPAKHKDLPTVLAWLEHAKPIRQMIDTLYHRMPEAKKLQKAIEQNVLLQLHNLQTLPAVAAKLASGGVRLHGWMYEFETGKMLAYSPKKDQFINVTKDVAGGVYNVRPLQKLAAG
ncbi:MAG: carbonic anhydrase [Vampirovibrio sp.]|nr:carbonic anhydrase [Vampirovibrio sp.]